MITLKPFHLINSVKENILKYNIIPRAVVSNQQVVVEAFCNSITFINIGTTVCLVNGIILNPSLVAGANGESFSFGGNRGEVFQGRIDIAFATGVGNLLVIQKIYLPDNETFKDIN